MFLHAYILCFVFFRMGNFTSSTTVGSSTACVQYVQVRRPCGTIECCGSLSNLVLPVLDQFTIHFSMFYLFSCISRCACPNVDFLLVCWRFLQSATISVDCVQFVPSPVLMFLCTFLSQKSVDPEVAAITSYVKKQTVSKKLSQTKPWSDPEISSLVS